MSARDIKKIIFALFVVTSFFGCKNFYNGEEFLTELDSSIAYLNAKQAAVTIRKTTVDDPGVLEPVGRLTNQKIGYPFDVSFTPSSAYDFIKWNAVGDDGQEFSSEQVFIDDSSALKTSVTVFTEEQVYVQAMTASKQKLTLNFSVENGTSYPYEKKEFNIGESFLLSWNDTLNSYAFLGWQVIDTATDEPLENYEEYLTFENILAKNTEVKILNIGKALTLKAITQQYPKVISATPIYRAEGVYRDRSVIIHFDCPLTEDSIYFEESEIPEDATVLKKTDGDKERLYGYIVAGGGLIMSFINV